MSYNPNPKFEALDPMTRALMAAIAEITDAMANNRKPVLKSLKQLAGDLREHANRYAFDDGNLCADLKQAANYLEAMANG